MINLEVLKQEEMFNLRFSRLSHRKRGIDKGFSSYKLSSKL